MNAAVPSQRAEFAIPPTEDGARHRAPHSPAVYLCGNSLGLMPVRTRAAVVGELDKWSQFGVEGHFRGDVPWVSIEDTVVPLAEQVVGAQPGACARARVCLRWRCRCPSRDRAALAADPPPSPRPPARRCSCAVP